MGRHSSGGRQSWPVLAVGVSAILVAGAYAVNRFDPPTQAGRATTPSGSPDTPRPTGSPSCVGDRANVTVSASPDIAPAVRTVAARLSGPDCVRYDVVAVPAGAQLDQLGAGATPPQIWVPDSAVWLQQYAAASGRSLAYGDVVATSPVGIAIPQVRVGHGLEPGSHPWPAIIGAGQSATPAVPDPQRSTATMLLLAAAQASAAGSTEMAQKQATLLAQPPRDAAELMQTATSGAATSRPFPASEQAILAQRKTTRAQPLSAAIVEGATPQLAFGVVPLDAADTTTRAADALRAALRSPEGADVLADNGFRVPGHPSQTTPSAVTGFAQWAGGSADPSLAQTQAVAKAWTAVHRTMRVLLAVDESGSMREKATPTRTRIQLASDVALTALGQLPGRAQAGVWAFSDSRRGKGTPWVELSPIASLDARLADGRTQRDRLTDVARELPALTGGNTALFDTIRDAVAHVQDSYDPAAVQTVLVWTDGVNDDAGVSTKAQLLAQLRAVAKSDKPVRVILVGMGQKTDMETLQEIAEASGGAAYHALDADAIKRVIADAFYARVQRAGVAPS